MIEVELEEHEVLYGAFLGVRRHAEALARGLPDRHGAEASWDLHVEGACGEMAFAKAVNRYWDGSCSTFRTKADVGALEVRTRSKPWYELIVREDDADDSVFVLVTGRAPRYSVRGWIKAGDAKKAEWLQTHGGREAAYFVPHVALAGF